MYKRQGYKRLIDDFNYDQEKVAKFIGKSRAHVSNCLRLLNLPQKIIEHIIDEKISKAQRDLELIRSAYMNDGNNGTEDTSPTFKAFEEGSQTMSKEANTQLAIRQEKFIRDLKNALIRIENKTYGICRVTGKLISKKRLQLVPHATLSIEAKNSLS